MSKSMTYFDTLACRSGEHCRSCRNNVDYRLSIAEAFSVAVVGSSAWFDCPYGVPDDGTAVKPSRKARETLATMRHDVCSACEYYTGAMCDADNANGQPAFKCGACYERELRNPRAKCPIGKWKPITEVNKDGD
jgi:hypothetical protein